MNNTDINSDLRELFDLIHSNIIPSSIQVYSTNTDLFCLYKDPDELSKTRSLHIPSAARQIIATHITQSNSVRFV